MKVLPFLQSQDIVIICLTKKEEIAYDVIERQKPLSKILNKVTKRCIAI